MTKDLPLKLPRGIRNHNPGNIEYNAANQWRGQLPHDPSIEVRFCRFRSAHYGLRALAVLLKNYYRRYQLQSVSALINRFAPSGENNTGAYVKAVSTALGVKPDEPLTLGKRTLQTLVAAIVQHENGQQPYSAAQIAAAVEEALP